MIDDYWVSPREANLLVTGRCNLKCKHCSVNSHGNLQNDLPLSSWIHILEKLKEDKLLRLTLTGGEPFCRSDIAELVSAVAERPFRFSINTNGTLITPNVIQTLKKNQKRFDGFMISLDGPNEDIVDAQRGTGVFSRLLQGVKQISSAGLPFGFYCTVTSINVMHLDETAKLALALGTDWIKFNYFLYTGPLLEKNMIPIQSEVNKATEKLLELKKEHPDKITGTFLEMKERTIRYKNGSLTRNTGRAYSCGGGRVKVTIFPDGTVTPCDHLTTFSLGNIMESSLRDILNGRKMDEFTELLGQKRSDCGFCTNCKYMEYCSGGCPVEAICTHGATCYDWHSCLKIALENND